MNTNLDLTNYIVEKTNSSKDKIELLTQRLNNNSNISLNNTESHSSNSFNSINKEINNSSNEIIKKNKRKPTTPERYIEKKPKIENEKKIIDKNRDKENSKKAIEQNDNSIETIGIKRFLTQTASTQVIHPVVVNQVDLSDYQKKIQALYNENQRLVDVLQQQGNEQLDKIKQQKEILIPIITSYAIDRCQLRRKVFSENSYKYGYQTYVRQAQNLVELWVEGEEYKEIVREEMRISQLKDKQQKKPKKKKRDNESDELSKLQNKRLLVFFYNIE